MRNNLTAVSPHRAPQQAHVSTLSADGRPAMMRPSTQTQSRRTVVVRARAVLCVLRKRSKKAAKIATGGTLPAFASAASWARDSVNIGTRDPSPLRKRFDGCCHAAGCQGSLLQEGRHLWSAQAPGQWLVCKRSLDRRSRRSPLAVPSLSNPARERDISRHVRTRRSMSPLHKHHKHSTHFTRPVAYSAAVARV